MPASVTLITPPTRNASRNFTEKSSNARCVLFTRNKAWNLSAENPPPVPLTGNSKTMAVFSSAKTRTASTSTMLEIDGSSPRTPGAPGAFLPPVRDGGGLGRFPIHFQQRAALRRRLGRIHRDRCDMIIVELPRRLRKRPLVIIQPDFSERVGEQGLLCRVSEGKLQETTGERSAGSLVRFGGHRNIFSPSG